jgi:hypothetical protein
MAPHTPGPWYLRKETTRGEFVTDRRIRDKNDGVIATLGPVDQDGNGALIEAAPRLLAALEALTEWAREHTSPRDENSPHALLIEAVAAISQARGGV